MCYTSDSFCHFTYNMFEPLTDLQLILDEFVSDEIDVSNKLETKTNSRYCNILN